MLAKRIIPCLDIKAGRVVKGTSFVGLRDAGDPIELAQRYNEQSADELVFLDIAASLENRGTTIELATKLARELFIPFTIGGGISSLDHIADLVTAGADKISINSSALKNPDLITEGAKRFGSQCIVVAIDAKKVGDHWEVFSHGGTRSTGRNAMEWAQTTDRTTVISINSDAYSWTPGGADWYVGVPEINDRQSIREAREGQEAFRKKQRQGI